MSIAGRFGRERERLLGMTDEERAFRSQWLKDQVLAADEPRVVPEMYKATHNPIRRAYRWPLDQLGRIIEPIVGKERAVAVRYLTGKCLLGVAGIYLGVYYLKYNANNWTRTGGWRVMKSRSSCVEGDEGYPRLSDRNVGADYGSRGFKDFKLDL